jgi:hypothetical protein
MFGAPGTDHRSASTKAPDDDGFLVPVTRTLRVCAVFDRPVTLNHVVSLIVVGEYTSTRVSGPPSMDQARMPRSDFFVPS